MRLSIARVGVVAAVAGLIGVLTPPASATAAKVLVFTGTVDHPGGLGYPGIGWDGGLDPNKIPCTDNLAPDPNCVEVKTGPKGDPQVNFRPEGNHSAFGFSSIMCAKATLSLDPWKKTPGPQLCAIRAAGVIWGYCGLSTGIGLATVEDTTPVTVLGLKQSQSIAVKYTEVGGVLYVTGGGFETHLYAVLLIWSPPSTPGGPSCTNKTATTFLMTGTAVVEDCTPTTDVPVACGP